MIEGFFVLLWRQCCFLRLQHLSAADNELSFSSLRTSVHKGSVSGLTHPASNLASNPFICSSCFGSSADLFAIRLLNELQFVSYGLQTNEHEEVKLDEWI